MRHTGMLISVAKWRHGTGLHVHIVIRCCAVLGRKWIAVSGCPNATCKITKQDNSRQSTHLLTLCLLVCGCWLTVGLFVCVSPQTLENTREKDVTMVAAGDEEVAADEADDEFAAHFDRHREPKVLLTTCYKPSKLMFQFLSELLVRRQCH